MTKSASRTYFTLACTAFLFVAFRAANLSITHDEALSWQIMNGSERWAVSANNHWLNTILGYVCIKLFGDDVFILRLPNLMAFAFYLYCGYRLLRLFPLPASVLFFVMPMALLSLYVLDFFGLCRGYGLAMAFCFSFFIQALEWLRTGRYSSLWWFLLSGIAMVYANYSFLICFIAVSLALGILSLNRIKSWKLSQWIILPAAMLLLVPAIYNIQLLKEMQELYFGGERDILHDTFRSLINGVFPVQITEYHNWIHLTLMATIIASAIQFIKNPHVKMLLFSALLLAVLPIVLFYAMGMRYPMGRAAMYWLLLYGVIAWVVASMLISRSTITFRKWQLLMILLPASWWLAYDVHFANLSRTIEWSFDEKDKSVAGMVVGASREERQSMVLAVHWLMLPSVKYYLRRHEGLVMLVDEREAVRADFWYTYLGPEMRLSPDATALDPSKFAPVLRAEQAHTLVLMPLRD